MHVHVCVSVCVCDTVSCCISVLSICCARVCFCMLYLPMHAHAQTHKFKGKSNKHTDASFFDGAPQAPVALPFSIAVRVVGFYLQAVCAVGLFVRLVPCVFTCAV
jgi:hypothetical protein